jgi:hypothetical protein
MSNQNKKAPPGNDGAISEILYGDANSSKASTKVEKKPIKSKVNLFSPPSLLPEDRGDCFQKGFAVAERIFRNDDAVAEDKYLLQLFRRRVKQIRNKMIKKGQIEPANKEERKLRLNL